jgi:hypothetical protein
MTWLKGLYSFAVDTNGVYAMHWQSENWGVTVLDHSGVWQRSVTSANFAQGDSEFMFVPGQLVVDSSDTGAASWVYTLGVDGTLARFSADQHQVIAHLGQLCPSNAWSASEFTGLRVEDPVRFTGLALQNYTRHDASGALERQVLLYALCSENGMTFSIDANQVAALSSPPTIQLNNVQTTTWIDILGVSLSHGRISYLNGNIYSFTGRTEWVNGRGFLPNTLWLRARDISVSVPCSAVMSVIRRPLEDWATPGLPGNVGTAYTGTPKELLLADGMSQSGDSKGKWSFKVYKSVLAGVGGNVGINKIMACAGPMPPFTRKASMQCCTKKWTNASAAEAHRDLLDVQVKLYVNNVPSDMST